MYELIGSPPEVFRDNEIEVRCRDEIDIQFKLVETDHGEMARGLALEYGYHVRSRHLPPQHWNVRPQFGESTQFGKPY